MRTVNRFESNLLQILRCFMGQGRLKHVLPLLMKPIRRPDCLSRDTVELVSQTLSIGTTIDRSRASGWRTECFLRDDSAQTGRLWERTKPEKLGLTFSAKSLEFLMWITSADMTNRNAMWFSRKQQSGTSLTSGDQYLMYRVAQTLRTTQIDEKWYRKGVYPTNPLIALLLPDRFAESGGKPEPDFDDWMTGSKACLLESMQSDLTAAWVTIERNRRHITRPESVRRLGDTQEFVLNGFLKASQNAGRRDLCGFLIDAFTQLVTTDADQADWIGVLDVGSMRLADRTKLYRQASVFLRSVETLRNWQNECQSVGYFDLGYAESQWFKEKWEATQMDATATRAEQILREMSF